jgi:uncharacterized BrkB/YihY/UPF0761 family membrane protein
LNLLVRERAVTGLLGTVGLAVFASQLVSLIRTIMNLIFRVPTRRGMFRGLGFDLVALAVAPLRYSSPPCWCSPS